MQQTRRTLAALPPAKRDELHWAGLGPGDGYIGTWKMVHSLRHTLIGIMDNLHRDDLTDDVRKAFEEKRRYYTQQILACYCTVMPYEKAKLQSITLMGDPNKPLHMTHDFSSLSDGELDVLARILPKLGGAVEGDAADGDITAGSRGTTAAPGTARDRGNRKGLRKAKKATDR